MRAELVLEPGLGGALRLDPGGETCRVHHLGRWCPNQVGLGRLQRLEIGRKAARIAAEILVRRASRTSAKWPRWSAPMVGTRAIRSPVSRNGARARRSDG